MNILLLTAHSIAEHDDLRMLSEIGHDVFSIGAYLNPSQPTDDKRPPLPQVPYVPDLAAMVEGDQMAHKANLPDGLIDWADTIIVHHFPETWIGNNWPRIKGKRVIWRTCGQSNPALEQYMAGGRAEGMEIVRYSPKERSLPNYAGEDALIRFGKDPDEWCGWTGEDRVVANVTQNMVERGDACGYSFWQAATKGLPTSPAGPGSEQIGGVGNLTYDQLRAYLRRSRVYLYTGTQPASYTLGLIEAMMTGIPVISIGPKAFGGDSFTADLFEGHEITKYGYDDPADACRALQIKLDNRGWARIHSEYQRQATVDLFGIDAIREQWRAFLG